MKSKLTILLLACSLFLTTLPSCQKDKDDDGPKSRTELLTSSLWKISSVKMTIASVEVPYQMEDCEKDDTFEFKANGTGISYDGVKCDPDDPATQEFTWSFQSNETVLRIAIPGTFIDGDATITTLNATTLEAYMDYTDPGTQIQSRITLKLVH